MSNVTPRRMRGGRPETLSRSDVSNWKCGEGHWDLFHGVRENEYG